MDGKFCASEALHLRRFFAAIRSPADILVKILKYGPTSFVERHVIPGFRAVRFRGAVVFLAWTLIRVSLVAAAATPAARDTLVYKDGDRVHGSLVQDSDNVIVFKSERF